MTDERSLGIGHNRPPAPKFELKCARGISCDWTSPKGAEPRPRHFERYWRIYRDGKLMDSFRTKARAVQALRRLALEGADD